MGVPAHDGPMTAGPHRTSAQQLGDAAEDLVAAHLATLGWSILGRQVRVGRHEVDLVAVDRGPPAELVVVEVRWRSRRDFGHGEETFDWRKRRHLHQALFALQEAGRLPGGRVLPRLPGRVDLVVVEPPAAGAGGVPGTAGPAPPRLRHHRSAA